MMNSILERIKRVIQTIFRGSELKSKIGVQALTSEQMTQAIELWSSLYEGAAPWISEEDGVKSLNLPAAVASELARLTVLEMKSEISGSGRADFLNEQYQAVLDNIRLYTEYACAKSGLVFKPYVSGGRICVSCIQADSFYPTAFDSAGRITGAVFADRITHGEVFYTRLEYHESGTQYTIRNRAFSSRSRSEIGHEVALTSVTEWADIQPQVSIANVKQPLFGFFKMPMANTIDPDSPLGVSVYARAVDLIREADEQYSRLLWEFESGERALYIHDTAFQLDKNGKRKLPNKRLYRTIGVTDDKLFEEWTPTLRDANILNGLNAILRRVEYNCGLAYGTLSDVQDTDKTAEEIKASKQRSYATVSDIQRALKAALCDLVYAMDVLCTLYRLAPNGQYDVSFEFDDSIVADRQAEFAEKQQLVTSGIMQPWEFRMWYFGETEEEARQNTADGGADADGFRITDA